MNQKELKIPQERVAVLIGKNAESKKALEKAFDCKISVDSEGLTIIEGKDSLKIWDCEKAVKAIGRGFNPDLALLLKNEDYDFELISINDYAKGKKDNERLKGRVIGKDGSSKEMIEKKTNSFISIYGKTVGVIALQEMIELALSAIKMLLSGAKHSTVFNYIDKELREKNKGAVF